MPFEFSLEVIAVPKKGGERWLEVRLVDGRHGWIQWGDVEERTSKTLSIEEAIALAKKFMGVTYTWGGTLELLSYDCSGFMQMVMRSRGVVMPRDADVQAAWGSGVVPVKREDLKPGDLLYFGKSAKNITHTGITSGTANSFTIQRTNIRWCRSAVWTISRGPHTRSLQESEIMNRRDWLKTAGAVSAAAALPIDSLALPENGPAKVETEILRLNLRHKWTTTMSSSPYPRHIARSLYPRWNYWPWRGRSDRAL